jgi:hypothetical protein
MKCIHVLGLLFCGFLLNTQAQTPVPVSDAPVPQVILSAKTAFVSDKMTAIWNLSGSPTRGYNQFYTALRAVGRYELVDDPSNADLVLELETVPFDSIRTAPDGIRLLIYDRKTHYVLWTLVHPIEACVLRKACDKNFDLAINGLIHDLKVLSSQSLSGTNH